MEPRDRSARSDAAHDGVDARSWDLLDDFPRGGESVSRRIVGILELPRLERAALAWETEARITTSGQSDGVVLGQGGGSGVVFAELKACTPASLSPSNGVTGPSGPRQKSSPVGSANQAPT